MLLKKMVVYIQLAKYGKSASMLRKSYPNYYISKNKIELTPEIDVNYILKEITKKYKKQPINTLDGVKIEFDKEWVHLRKSNTEPIFRYFIYKIITIYFI